MHLKLFNLAVLRMVSSWHDTDLGTHHFGSAPIVGLTVPQPEHLTPWAELTSSMFAAKMVLQMSSQDGGPCRMAKPFLKNIDQSAIVKSDVSCRRIQLTPLL